MELWDTRRDLFAVVGRVNNVYPIKLTVVLPDSGFVAWMKEEGHEDLTDQDIVKRLDDVALVATVKGGKGSGVSFMTCIVAWQLKLMTHTLAAALTVLTDGFDIFDR